MEAVTMTALRIEALPATAPRRPPATQRSTHRWLNRTRPRHRPLPDGQTQPRSRPLTSTNPHQPFRRRTPTPHRRYHPTPNDPRPDTPSKPRSPDPPPATTPNTPQHKPISPPPPHPPPRTTTRELPRVATEPDRTRPFPETVDRTLTGLNHRVDLVLLLGDALHDGVHRSVLRHRYPRLGRRLIRVALQHQPPRRFKRRSPDASTIFEAINHLDIDDTIGRT